MTATDELRALLDERGVNWGNIRNDGSESDYLTEWQLDDRQGHAVAIERVVGGDLSMELHRHNLTPEQTIAATLGDGTLQAENAKLRELCADLYDFAMSEYPEGTELTFADSMRELGIEVDE